MTRTKMLMAQAAKARDAAEAQMPVDYPIGRQVSWTHGAHDRGGEVIRHGYGLRVQVRSIGKREYWIDVHRLHD